MKAKLEREHSSSSIWERISNRRSQMISKLKFKINSNLKFNIKFNLKWFFVLVIILSIPLIYWGNHHIDITYFEVTHADIPLQFEGMKILQISDLHNQTFGKGQQTLIEKIKAETPDIIVITGDIVDQKKFDLQPVQDLVSSIVSVAPVYYVSGNHEAWSGRYEEVKSVLIKAGVVVLENESVAIKRMDESIRLLGLQDPAFNSEMSISVNEQVMEGDFTMVLSHRPEFMDEYVNSDYDLVFCGHAHGGQFRLPFIGGVIAPNQGLFPEYDAGVFHKSDTTMILSRGLGNSIIPVRLFNLPEIVVVTLVKE